MTYYAVSVLIRPGASIYVEFGYLIGKKEKKMGSEKSMCLSLRIV
jgi:hypothetical protein